MRSLQMLVHEDDKTVPNGPGLVFGLAFFLL
jgi:hypothetical protein